MSREGSSSSCIESLKDVLKTYSVVNDFMLRPPLPPNYDFSTFDRFVQGGGVGGNAGSATEEPQNPAAAGDNNVDENDEAAAERINEEINQMRSELPTRIVVGGEAATGGKLRSTSSSVSLHMLFIPHTTFTGVLPAASSSSPSSIDTSSSSAYGVKYYTNSTLYPPVPCLYIKHNASPYLMVFFHGNASDIGYPPSAMLELYALKLRVSVLAVEYPGYGVTVGQHYSEAGMISNADSVINFLLGSTSSEIRPPLEPHQLILMGQSIGTGVTMQMVSRIYDRFSAIQQRQAATSSGSGSGKKGMKYLAPSTSSAREGLEVPVKLGAVILKSGFASIKNVITHFAEMKETQSKAYFAHFGGGGKKGMGKGPKTALISEVDKTSDDGQDVAPGVAVTVVTTGGDARSEMPGGQVQSRRVGPNNSSGSPSGGGGYRGSTATAAGGQDEFHGISGGTSEESTTDGSDKGLHNNSGGDVDGNGGEQYVPDPPGSAGSSPPLLFQLGRYVTLDRFRSVDVLERLGGGGGRGMFSSDGFHKYPNTSLHHQQQQPAKAEGKQQGQQQHLFTSPFTPLLLLHGMADDVIPHHHTVVNYHAARGDPKHTWLNVPPSRIVNKGHRQSQAVSSASRRKFGSETGAGAGGDGGGVMTEVSNSGIQLVLYPETGHNNIVALTELMPFFQKLPLFGNTDPAMISIDSVVVQPGPGLRTAAQQRAAALMLRNQQQQQHMEGMVTESKPLSPPISSTLFQDPESHPLVPSAFAARLILEGIKNRKRVSQGIHALVLIFALVVLILAVAHGAACGGGGGGDLASSSSTTGEIFVPQFIVWGVFEAICLTIITFLSYNSNKYGMAAEEPVGIYFLGRIAVYGTLGIVTYILAPYWLSASSVWASPPTPPGSTMTTGAPEICSDGFATRGIMTFAVVCHYLHLLWTVIRNK